MSNIPPEPSAPVAEAISAEEIDPGWDVPMATLVTEPVEGDIPMALPVGLPTPAKAEAVHVAMPLAPTDPDLLLEPPPAPSAILCPACTASNPLGQPYCSDCGYYFSASDLAAPAAPIAPEAAPAPLTLLHGRYELGELLSDRLGVQRFRAIDRGDDSRPTLEVAVVRQKLPPAPAPSIAGAEDKDDILPSFDDPGPMSFPATEILVGQPLWPSIAWERKLLRTLEHPGLPAMRDHFCDDEYEYLVEERPTGTSLWDAYDDPDAGARERFGHLSELAELMHRLHQCNAMFEGIRPGDVVVADDGRVRLAHLTDLLPIPLPLPAPVRGGLYSAPELLTGNADARADLYSFGALLYSLHVGRELNEKTDFDGPGNPKPFIPRFPDVHPSFGRLMMKTFRKEVGFRFPSDEASREDGTGFSELIRTLEVLRRTYDNVRLEIACWTSTGIIRTGNEDAFAVLHATESRQDDLGEAALVILCDGMGGYEAGEIAAALTIQSLRKQLSQMPPFNVAAGASPFPTDPLTQMANPSGHAAPPIDVEAVKLALKTALRDANRYVFQTSRAPGSKRRGMGCTAEAVYVDGRNVVVGHVGDSRVYHLHEGRLIQLTRDQTLVNRLVELGSLTEEEAETHPRRNELQQAIGGQPDVEPGLYHNKMSSGDWIIVCSDGLTNHVNSKDLKQMLQTEAGSAEVCARRLVNLTLIEGATDNVTVVAIRAT
jgi:protein phosphatase